MKLDVSDYVLSEEYEYLAELVHSVGEMAKTAKVHSLEELRKLDDDQIALVLYHKDHGEIPKFATTDPGIVSLNIQLLADKIGKLPDEVVKTAAANLGFAASHMDIDIPEKLAKYQQESFVDPHVNIADINIPAFHKKLSKSQSIKKTASQEEYALPQKQKFDISDKGHVKTAVAYFNQAGDLSIQDRIEFAQNVYPKAKEIDHWHDDLSLIKKYATLDIDSFGENFEAEIHARKRLTHKEDMENLYTDLWEKHAELGPVKTARVLQKIDEHSGMNRAYQKHIISNPVLAVFGQTKEADVFFQKLSQVSLEEYVDSYTAQALQSEDAADVFHSLPDPTKRMLREAVQDNAS